MRAILTNSPGSCIVSHSTPIPNFLCIFDTKVNNSRTKKLFSIAQLTLKLLLKIDHQFNKDIYFEYIGMRLATIFCHVKRKKMICLF